MLRSMIDVVSGAVKQTIQPPTRETEFSDVRSCSNPTYPGSQPRSRICLLSMQRQGFLRKMTSLCSISVMERKFGLG